MLLERNYKVGSESFSADKNFIDGFYYSVSDLIEKSALKDLWELVQLLLTLLYGQPAVVRGFSINSSLLHPNFKSHLLVAQRIFYDLTNVTDKLQVTPGLMKSCSWAYRRYMDYLQQQTDQRMTEEREKEKKESKLIPAQKKLKQLEHAVQSLTTETDEHASTAEKKQSFTLLSKSNA